MLDWSEPATSPTLHPRDPHPALAPAANEGCADATGLGIIESGAARVSALMTKP